ncbi:MAG: hypothetical protein ACXVQY_08120 [Actinomycetota bacterium]
MTAAGRRVAADTHGIEPLPPRKKWRAITIATLAFVPAFWAMLTGLVTGASDSRVRVTNPGAAVALGLSLIPFVFMVLAFMSQHPRAAGAVLKAMGLSLLVAVPVSALAADAVTGIVAGVGAGGIAALRPDAASNLRSRSLSVLAGSLYVYLMIRVAPGPAILIAPVVPFTVIGIADHLSQRKQERETAGG